MRKKKKTIREEKVIMIMVHPFLFELQITYSILCFSPHFPRLIFPCVLLAVICFTCRNFISRPLILKMCAIHACT